MRCMSWGKLRMPSFHLRSGVAKAINFRRGTVVGSTYGLAHNGALQILKTNYRILRSRAPLRDPAGECAIVSRGGDERDGFVRICHN